MLGARAISSTLRQLITGVARVNTLEIILLGARRLFFNTTRSKGVKMYRVLMLAIISTTFSACSGNGASTHDAAITNTAARTAWQGSYQKIPSLSLRQAAHVASMGAARKTIGELPRAALLYPGNSSVDRSQLRSPGSVLRAVASVQPPTEAPPTIELQSWEDHLRRHLDRTFVDNSIAPDRLVYVVSSTISRATRVHNLLFTAGVTMRVFDAQTGAPLEVLTRGPMQRITR